MTFYAGLDVVFGRISGVVSIKFTRYAKDTGIYFIKLAAANFYIHNYNSNIIKFCFIAPSIMCRYLEI